MTIRKIIGALGLSVACWCLTAHDARAQSTSMSAPSAVRSNEVIGSIKARDLGDSRLTDHYFAFTGTPGDLLITVGSNNLNGDIDVFTLTGMRPLMKFTVYDGSQGVVTKSVYLRKRENLILRIEARTPNDDEGTYRLRFGGSFEPISGGPDGGLEIATTEAAEAQSGKKGRRVSSVGARIDEPVTEVAVAAPEPEPAEKPAREVTPPRSTSRTTRGRRPARGRTNPPTEQPAAEKPSVETKEEKQESVAESVPTADKPATDSRATTGRRRPGSRSAAARPVEKPIPPPEEESGPRLIIETSDGTLINRYMTSVRRVTVENGQVVVVGKDGKVERFRLANIVKMSVGP